MRIDEIKAILRKLSDEYLLDDMKQTCMLTSDYISEILGIKRNTVSYYLNRLWNEGKVIKVNTRPVYYIEKTAIEETWGVSVERYLFDSLDELRNHIASIKNRLKDPFTKAIGYNGSLYYQIEKCKAAAAYPPNGLPALILGDTGVGKSFFAELMYEYSVEKGIVSSDAPLIILNCAEYANNPELLTGNLFGYSKGAFTGADSDKKGLIEEADGGFLFLDEIHRLTSEGQEKLFLFMDKGVYRRLGENAGWRKSKVRFIFATTENPKNTFVDTFLRRIPIFIEIPPLMLRGQKEKLELIYRFFLEESKNMKSSIRISENVLNILLSYRFEGNVGELKNTIKYSCAKAFIRNTRNGIESMIEINLNHLPNELLKSNWLSTESTDLPNIHINNEILISPDSKEEKFTLFEDRFSFEALYTDVFNVYEDLKLENIVEYEFINSSLLKMDKHFDKFFFEANIYSDIDIKFNIIRKALEKVFDLMKNNYGLKFYGNTILVFSHYIYLRLRYGFLEVNGDFKKYSKEITEFLETNYSKEYFLTEKMLEQIEASLDIKIRQEDKIIFTLYIKGINKSFDANKIRALILAHGYSTASSIANVANRLLGQYIFEAFDMPIDLSVDDMILKVKDYVNNIDTSNGLIILVDMGSLEKIYYTLEDIADGVIGVINNITTQLALDTGSKIMKGLGIDDIVEKVTANNKSSCKIIRPKKKKKAIVTTCVTGIGTANKIKKLLEESIGDNYDELSIISCEYISLKNDGARHNIFKSYEVLAIVGTANPNIPHIPYIALEDMVSGDSKQYRNQILLNLFDKKSYEKINQNLIKLFSLQSIINYLTILNPDRIINYIETAIGEMERLLGEKFSNGAKISLYIHLSCLIERLIQKTPIENYDNMEEFEKCHKKFIELAKRSFSVIEDTYSVQIPISEIGYVYDIIKSKLGDLKV